MSSHAIIELANSVSNFWEHIVVTLHRESISKGKRYDIK